MIINIIKWVKLLYFVCIRDLINILLLYIVYSDTLILEPLPWMFAINYTQVANYERRIDGHVLQITR